MNWTVTSLGDLANVVGGGTPSTRVADFWGGPIPWFTPAEIPESGAGIVTASERSITNKGLAESAARLLPPGTVLVTSRASIGNCAIAGASMATNQGFTSLTPKNARSTRFLYYWVQQNRGEFLSRAAGSTFLEISASKVRAIPIAAPGPDEQAIIGEAIADADSLIATLERLIAKKQAIKEGMMQQLLTGRTRLPGFDAAWSDAKLGSISTVIMGQSPAGHTYNSDGRGLPLVQGNADIRNRVTFDRIWTDEPTKVCNEGDALLTVRAPVGYTAIASKRSCLGRGVCAISTQRDNRYLFHALVYSEPAWALYEQGSTFTAVNSNEVRSFVIQWPSDVAERAAIAAVLDEIDNVLRTLQGRLTKARAIKSGMMQQLLTGRTRLPVEAVS